MAAVGTATKVASIVDQVLGTDTLPVANQTLDQALGLATDFLHPFQTVINQGASAWSSVASQLQSAGFSIPLPFTGTADANNNLLEVNWSQALAPTDPIQILGQTGLSYLDGAGGGLFGGITATGSVTVNLTFGVDVNPTTQQLGFFVAPGTGAVKATLTGSTAANGLSGTLDIGDLASVSATASAGVSFTGTLGLQATGADKDGKIRAGDLTSNLAQVVTGGVNGSANVNVSQFDAKLFGLPDITWSGVITKSVVNNANQAESDSLQEPSPSSLLSSLGSSLFSLGDGIPVLGTLSNTLNKPLPLIGESIAQLTGLDKDLPSLPSLPSGFSNLNGTHPLAGGTLTVNVTPTTIDEFLKGQDVSLVSFETSDDIDLVDEDITVPIFSLGVPDIASVELDATFGIHASFDYDLGFGLDGHGFYALAGTPTDPTFGLSFGVTAGVQGQVEVFGLPLAEAGGDVGFSVTPYVSLTPAPTSVDPASDPTKVYLSDLALFGSDPASDLLDDLSAGIEGDFTGEVYASLDLLFFSLSWKWGISIPVFNYERSPTWPSLPGGGAGATPWPNVTQHGGVLTFTGTAAADGVTLSQGTPSAPNSPPPLTVAWAGQGSETFNNVTSVVFDGGAGADTLTAAPGLDVPVRAIGGSGNDTFDLRNNAGNDTLVAGTGVNNLYGGSGTDLLIGGKGSDSLTAGSGPTTIYGGTGNATVHLGSGHDSFYGGSGNYNIQGGSGTYSIDGGSGSDVINAGTGSHDTIYGGGAGDNTITGSSGGYDTIYGGGAGDVIVGGGGYETIYGSGGSVPGSVTGSTITGGPLGNNTIFGGGGGDFLAGGIGSNNTLYAGTGNETLAGGDGLGLVANPQGNGLIDAAGDDRSSGNNTLIGGSGNDILYGDTRGQNVLQAGNGNDTLFAGSGGDTLIAGLGTDSLYGSIGNDTFQVPFTPIGQAQPVDTMLGGGGKDTLLLKAESGTGSAGLDITANAIPDSTSTSVTVSNGLPIAADLPANGSGLVIQIGDEQMLVTKVVGNVLTVQRGYAGTTAISHGNAALVLLPNTVAPLAAPVDQKLYLNQAGAANQYTATLSTLRFGVTTSGSKTVTGIDNTAGLSVGQAVAGPGIPTGATIASIPSSTTITLSSPSTLSQGNLPLTFGTIAGVSLTLPGDIPNIELEGGPGNNWIEVDPSVTRDVTLYGGSGNNILMAGSGNDTLIAGPGTSVLYGGTGQDTLYGGDLPSQDIAPTNADPARTITQATGAVDGNDVLIAGPGDDELFAGSGNDLLIGGSVARQVDPVTGTPGVALLQAGQYQLIEGAGRDILAGGAGNDVLIAGPGSPGEVLEAGSGTNTLIAQDYGVNTLSGGQNNSLLLGGNLENFEISNSGTTHPGATVAGSPTVTAIDSTAGLAVGDAVTGPGIPAGTTLVSILSPTSITLSQAATITSQNAAQLTFGGNTLVGGWGIDNLEGGAGSDVLYASYDAASWSRGEAIAAAFGVHVVPPQFFQGDSTSATIQTLLAKDQAGTLTADDRKTLGQKLQDELDSLQAQEQDAYQTLNDEFSLLNGSSGPNSTLYTQLQAALTQFGYVLTELGVELSNIATFINATSFLQDQLTGGTGNTVFYGNVGGNTTMSGPSGNNTFYNDAASDTIHGNLTGTNTLVLQDYQGNNSITLGQDAKTSNAVDFSLNGQAPQLVGDTGNVSGIQTLAFQLGSGNDSLTVNFGSLPSGLTALEVLSGPGNDTIDASLFTGNETLVGGPGKDVIKVGAVLGASSQLTGTPTTELDLVDNADLPVTVNAKTGLTVGSYSESLGQFGTFGTFVVVGGTGTNTFTTDGSISSVTLRGGSGSAAINNFHATGGTSQLIGGSGGATNNLTATGGTSQLIGGSGPNTFTLNGPGTYTVTGGSGTNTVDVQGDNNGDTIRLAETDSTNPTTGATTATVSVTGSLVATLKNLAPATTSISVLGGSGNDTLDASKMIMPVTLNGGTGSDGLLGGMGNDTLVFGSTSDTYNGGGGNHNQLLLMSNSKDTVETLPDPTSGSVLSFEWNGTPYYLTSANLSYIQSFAAANQANVAFADAYFNGNDWSNSTANSTASIQGSYVKQVYNGSSPTYYLQGGLTSAGIYSPFAPPTYIEQDSLFSGYSYTPATQGAVVGLTPSFLVNMISASAYNRDGTPDLPSFGLMLEQGGTLYFSSALYSPTSASNTWTQYSYSGELAASAFASTSGATPNFAASGGSIQFGIYLNGSDYGLSNGRGVPATFPTNQFYWGIANFNVLIDDGGLPRPATTLGSTLALSSSAATVTSGTPTTNLTTTITTGNYSQGFVDTTSWGDGTTSTGTVTPSLTPPPGYPTFIIGMEGIDNHIYATNGTHIATMTMASSDGGAVSVPTTFIGGLSLQPNGDLRIYGSATSYATLDSGVASFAVDNSTSTVFSLHSDGSLWALKGSSKTQVDSSVQSTLVGPDGTLYDIHTNGSLFSIAPASTYSLTLVTSSVRTLVEDGSGDLYRLDTNGSLHLLPPGSGQAWATLLATGEASTPVASITYTPGATSVDVVYADGNDWQLAGSTFSNEVGPTFSLSGIPSSITAGAPVTVTLTVLDAHGRTVSGYAGTVSLADSDSSATASGDGPPAQHMFVASDGGSFLFKVAFLTSGTETLTASAVGGPTASTSLAVNAGTATQFSVDPPEVVVGTAAPITVTAYDAYGNVVTGYTGSVTLSPVAGSAASPTSYTFTAADQGIHQYSVTFTQPGGQKLVASGGGLAGDGAILVAPAMYDLSRSTVSVAPFSVQGGGQVAVTLTVRDALGNPETSGGLTVAFALAAGSTGGGNFGATVDNGDGTYTALFTAGSLPGLDNFTATINGTSITSSPAAVTIVAATSTSLNSSPATSPFGQQVTFTATVVAASSGTIPTGSVAFFDGSTALGSSKLDGNGRATLSTTALVVGSHAITARYSGDAADAGSVGSGSLTISPNASLSFGNLTFTYNGSPQSVAVATGPANLAGVVVIYSQGGVAVASPTSAGSYTVTASLANANYVATPITGTLIIGQVTPKITWPNPSAISSATRLGPAQLDASANIPGTFSYGPPAGTFLNPGPNQALGLIFTPTDTVDYATVSASATINVLAPTSITLSTPSSTATYKQSVTFTVAVTPTSGGGIPTGTVTFLDGTTVLGTATLDRTGRATFSTASLSLGTRSITANYSGDSMNTASASTATPIYVSDLVKEDFFGDGKDDLTYYGVVPGTKLYGFVTLTAASGYNPSKAIIWDNNGVGFGNPSSIPVPADYFGEGKPAYAIWSPDGHGYMILQAISSVNPVESLSIDFGLTTDVPVVADVDGDGKVDFGVYGYDPNLGYRYDFLLSSKTSAAYPRGFDPSQPLIFNNYGYGYGVPGATPVVADFDGSGHAGFGVYIPSGNTGTFTYINVAIPKNTTGAIVNPPASYVFVRTYGFATDIPMAVDFDGDGKADLAFYGLDPRTGRYRYDILTSSSNFSTTKDVYFDNAGAGYGYSASIPVMADYEGNGLDDFGVFQPDGSGGASFIFQDVGVGHGVVYDFAMAGDLPIDAPTYLLAKKVRGH